MIKTALCKPFSSYQHSFSFESVDQVTLYHLNKSLFSCKMVKSQEIHRLSLFFSCPKDKLHNLISDCFPTLERKVNLRSVFLFTKGILNDRQHKGFKSNLGFRTLR